MKSPVDQTEIDEKEMQSYENPHRFDDKRLFKFGGLNLTSNWVDAHWVHNKFYLVMASFG